MEELKVILGEFYESPVYYAWCNIQITSIFNVYLSLLFHVFIMLLIKLYNEMYENKRKNHVTLRLNDCVVLCNRHAILLLAGSKSFSGQWWLHWSNISMELFFLTENASVVRCPFQDAYHFSYNNNTGGFCRNPTSYAQACAGTGRFNFHFKHCPEYAYTYQRGKCYLLTSPSGPIRYSILKVFLTFWSLHFENRKYCHFFAIL